MAKILIVDDSDLQRRLISDLLRRRFNHTCIEASNATHALAQLHKDAKAEIIAVLLDLSMPGLDGRDAIPMIRKLRPHLPIIVITGSSQISEAVAVLKLGASDYLVKPPNPDLLHAALRKAEELADLRQEVERLRQPSAAGFAALIGDKADRVYVKLAQRAATSDITVMITGESGVGKEVLARAIHGESARRDKPFVAVNCGALPKDLVESILFGHVKGAFTDAVSDAPGKFREAEGGTLFLDEVGELPLPAQVKLLRALQQREVEPVGGGKAVPVNIRVIAATNRDPAQDVMQGRFRQDLYYRLNVFPIHIPALRERAEDIDALADHFLRRYAALEGKKIESFDATSAAWLRAHPWPGNVRELENRIFRAVLLCEGPRISLVDIDLPASPLPALPAAHSDNTPTLYLTDGSGGLRSLANLREEIERKAMALCGGNIVLAAQRLGVGKSTLYRHKKK